MSKALKKFQERLHFELQSEKFLVDLNLKNCKCEILVNNHCVICGKEKIKLK